LADSLVDGCRVVAGGDGGAGGVGEATGAGGAGAGVEVVVEVGAGGCGVDVVVDWVEAGATTTCRVTAATCPSWLVTVSFTS
jgi:hypothetical protein